MRFWTWGILFFFSANLYSQVIEPPPLSVEDEGGRDLINRGARELKSSSIENPEDGKLKLDSEKSSHTQESSPEPTPLAQEVQVPLEHSQVIHAAVYDFIMQKRYLQIGFGAINSRYDKVYSTLDNGSEFMWFGFARDLNFHFQVGTLLQLISDKSPEKLPNNLRAVSANLFFDYHRPIYKDKIRGLMGLHFSVGNYSTRRLSVNGQGELLSTRLKSGAIIGLIPTLGTRFYFFRELLGVDLLAQYHHYFGKPQAYIGGFGYLTRVSFLF